MVYFKTVNRNKSAKDEKSYEIHAIFVAIEIHCSRTEKSDYDYN